MRRILAAMMVCAAATSAGAGAHECKTVCANLLPVRLEVLALDRLHSALSGALGYRRGFVPLLAEDVVLVVPGQPILVGKAAASSYFAGLDPDERLSWAPTRIDASVDGALGTSFGWTTATRRLADGTTTTALGKNIAVWKRVGPSWRVAAYLQTPSAAPQPSPPDFGLFPGEARRCATFADASDVADDIVAAEADYAALAGTTGFGPASAAYVAPDGVLRAGGMLFIGPDGVLELLGDLPPSIDLVTFAAAHAGAARSGDLGWTIGEATEVFHDPSGDEIASDSYLTLWTKQPDGAWRFAADSGN